jgi:methylglyoxal reductase
VRPLGTQGPPISEIGLGAWEAGGGRTWGPNRCDDEVVAALRTGFEAGATWIDTAEVYAKGRSEQVVGRAVQDRPDVLVFTKIGPRPDGTGVRAGQVRPAAHGSLRRLGRDVIDLYQLHWRDPDVPIEETWSAMAELVERGDVRWIGLSNIAAADVEACARLRHVDALQVQGSVLFRDELDGVLPLARRIGAAVLCYGPLGFGLVGGAPDATYADWRSGTYGTDDFFVAENYERFFSPGALARARERVARLDARARDAGVSTVQLALAWLLAQPGVTAAITGSRDPAHVRENVAAATLALPPEVLAAAGAIGRL